MLLGKPIVIIESPFAGDVERNRLYLRRAMRDSILNRDEVPFASHVLYTQMLDDDIPSERAVGIALGYEFWPICHAMAVYYDYGISPGMAAALEKAQSSFSFPIFHRKIGVNP